MKYPLCLAVLVCALVCCLTRAGRAAARMGPFGLRLRPCALLQAPTPREIVPSPSLELRLDMETRSPIAAVPLPDDGTGPIDAVMGALQWKKSPRNGAWLGADNAEAARWRWLRSSISDVSRAQRGYSVTGFLPTACLAAGGLTLAVQSGMLGPVKLAAKTWRAGGVLGIQASF